MYPHPELHSFIQDASPCVPKKILNKSIEKGMLLHNDVYKDQPSKMYRTVTVQPECFAPHVDVTRAPLAYGDRALPKLKRELSSDNPLVVRQAITTLGDLLVNPEKCMEAVRLRIPEKIANFLLSDDGYLRERAAMLHVTMGNQAAGRMAILANCQTIACLFEGLDDPIDAVRYKMNQALEALAHDGELADEFCKTNFIQSITSKLLYERTHILMVMLDVLMELLHRESGKEIAFVADTFEDLVRLLDRDDEKVVLKAFKCLTILCEHETGKRKADEMDLLFRVHKIMKDCKSSDALKTEAGHLSVFITVTTAGKLRFLQVGLLNPYLLLLSGKCCCSGELLLSVIKALTNVAEAPEGRKLLCEKHYELIENIEAGTDLVQRHREILLEVIRWKP